MWHLQWKLDCCTYFLLFIILGETLTNWNCTKSYLLFTMSTIVYSKGEWLCVFVSFCLFICLQSNCVWQAFYTTCNRFLCYARHGFLLNKQNKLYLMSIYVIFFRSLHVCNNLFSFCLVLSTNNNKFHQPFLFSTLFLCFVSNQLN